MRRLISAPHIWELAMGLHEVFLENLRDLFAKSGLSRRQLARMVGEHESTVSRWLSGDRQPNIDSVGLLAQSLGCTPKDLLSPPDEKSLDDRLRMERALRLKIASEIAESANAVVTPKGRPKKNN